MLFTSHVVPYLRFVNVVLSFYNLRHVLYVIFILVLNRMCGKKDKVMRGKTSDRATCSIFSPLENKDRLLAPTGIMSGFRIIRQARNYDPFNYEHLCLL